MASRLLIQKLPSLNSLRLSKNLPTNQNSPKKGEDIIQENENSEEILEKVWAYDFSSDPEKYGIDKNFSNFYRIFVNFHHKKMPIVFAVQGTNSGESLGLFVGKLENNQIQEIGYFNDFFNGEFVDVQFYKGRFYLLDSQMNLKVVKLPYIAS